MLISVHIPKTAGTSLKEALIDVFGKRLLLEYSTQPLSSSVVDRAVQLKCRLRVNCGGQRIVKRYDAIHGHFAAGTFVNLPCAKQFSVFLRDPVHRVISQYFHWKEEWKVQHSMFHRSHRRLVRHSVWKYAFQNKLSINEFAALPEMVNFYSIFLSGMSLEQFDFVGLQEEYHTSLRLFEKIFGIKVQERRDNIGKQDRREDLLADADLDGLRLTQEANLQIYDQARRRFDQLCSQYL